MADETIDSSRIEAAKEIAQQEEGPRRRLEGITGWLAASLAVAMSLLFIYWAWATVTAQMLRLVFLAFSLVLSFLLYPASRKGRLTGVPWFDWLLIGLSLIAIGYPMWDFEEFIYRAALPNLKDQILGALTILLVLEATRRTTGWILPAVALVFLAYAWLGPWLPPPWTHRGYGLDRLVGHMYLTLEGIFGVPLDVAATFIILFTIYGAVLEHSKAGEFYVNFSLAAMGSKPAGAGRTVTLASFLLGGPSGSGVATTITLGSVAYPLLVKAGYDKDSAGGLLSAGGIGAIISPPVLGAAAFLIAEFLKISYLEVIAMAAIPTLLYYWSIFTMVELDANKFGARPIALAGEGVWSLTRKYGYHFVSLVAIVVFMLWGYTAILSVVYAIFLAIAFELYPPRDGSHAGPSLESPSRWELRRALSGLHLRHRWNHRRRCNAYGPRPQVFDDHPRSCRRRPVSDRCLYGHRRVDPRSRHAGHGVVHYRCGDHGARDDQARHSSLCRAHVYLLLRRSLRGVSADGVVSFRRRGDHRRQSLPHDDVGVEIHLARFSGAVYFYLAPRRHRTFAQGQLGKYLVDDPERRDGAHRAGCRIYGLVLNEDYVAGTRASRRRRVSAALSRTGV